MKYKECFGLPPIIPTHLWLFSSDLMHGIYIGLIRSPPKRIGTMRTTDRQRWPRSDDRSVVSSKHDDDDDD